MTRQSSSFQALRDALEEYDAAGGNEAEKRIANVLDGLGFARSQWDVICDDLSGGWQMRVALARLLLSPAGWGLPDFSPPRHRHAYLTIVSLQWQPHPMTW